MNKITVTINGEERPIDWSTMYFEVHVVKSDDTTKTIFNSDGINKCIEYANKYCFNDNEKEIFVDMWAKPKGSEDYSVPYPVNIESLYSRKNNDYKDHVPNENVIKAIMSHFQLKREEIIQDKDDYENEYLLKNGSKEMGIIEVTTIGSAIQYCVESCHDLTEEINEDGVYWWNYLGRDNKYLFRWL